MESPYNMRTWTAVGVILFFTCALSAMIWGIFSQPVFAGDIAIGNFGWMFFAFISGIFMVTSPSMLPFVLSLLPLARKRKIGRLTIFLLAFSVGTTLVLSLIGFLTAFIGHTFFLAISYNPALIEEFILIALGVIVYTLALGEIDLTTITTRFAMIGSPRRLGEKGGVPEAFMLGIFVAGMSMHPATLALFAESTVSGDPIYGAGLLFMHAAARLLPLLLLVLLSIAGVNASSWLVERKDRIRAVLGWIMLATGAFVLNVGLQLFIAQNNYGDLVERLFREQWFIAFLLLLPLWILYYRHWSRVYGSASHEWRRIVRTIDQAKIERDAFLLTLNFPLSENALHVARIDEALHALDKERLILESSLRHEITIGIMGERAVKIEERSLLRHLGMTLLASLIIVSLIALLFSSMY